VERPNKLAAHMCFVVMGVSVPLQVELTASDWDECGAWLTALKRLIKIRQTLG